MGTFNSRGTKGRRAVSADVRPAATSKRNRGDRGSRILILIYLLDLLQSVIWSHHDDAALALALSHIPGLHPPCTLLFTVNFRPFFTGPPPFFPFSLNM